MRNCIRRQLWCCTTPILRFLSTSTISDLINLSKPLCRHQLDIQFLAIYFIQQHTISPFFHSLRPATIVANLLGYQYRDNVIEPASNYVATLSRPRVLGYECHEHLVTYAPRLTTWWQQEVHDLEGFTSGPKSFQITWSASSKIPNSAEVLPKSVSCPQNLLT